MFEENNVFGRIEQVIRPLPDVWTESLLLDTISGPYLTQQNGGLQKVQLADTDVIRILDLYGDSKPETPGLFLQGVDEDNVEQLDPVKFAGDKGAGSVNLVEDAPDKVAHILMKKIYGFYLREFLDLPEDQAIRLRRERPDNPKAAKMAPDRLEPVQNHDDFPFVEWEEAFTRARLAQY